MAKFLTSSDLNAKLESIIEEAEEYLILISPYIKLHDRYISAIKTLQNNPDIKIIIVFGKNEENYDKSLTLDDFNFFKEFPNIQIRYEKRLHAKFYANENTALLTSMNLYNFSQNNNIEAGMIGFLKDARYAFDKVIEQSELLFDNEPQFEEKLLGLRSKYVSSKIVEDKLSDFFNNRKKYDNKPTKNISNNKQKNKIPSNKATQSKKQMGYCIRTGVEIPFNIERPMSYDAYKSWKKFENPDSPEKFCHFSGEKTDGKTSVNKPILGKYWKSAKEVHCFK